MFGLIDVGRSAPPQFNKTTVPTTASRRPAGWLHQRLLALLAAAGRPLNAAELTERLHGGGEQIAVSAVFRALNRLLSERVIDRVELLSAYVPVSGAQRIFLTCRQCRSCSETVGAATAAALLDIARDRGFKPSRVAVEVEGLCAACRTGAS